MSINIFGKNCSLEFNLNSTDNFTIEYDKNVIECTEQHLEGNELHLELDPVSKGDTYLVVNEEDGTAVSAVRAAKHIPEFNKDFILILGCQITKDGGLTKLLQSRTDRAIEFANMQKKATGRDIVFVSSGGKGDDEVIAEAEAIHNYLVSTGIMNRYSWKTAQKYRSEYTFFTWTDKKGNR